MKNSEKQDIKKENISAEAETKGSAVPKLRLKLREFLNRSTVIFILYDLIIAFVSYFLALWLRFDCRYTTIPGDYLFSWLLFAPFYAVMTLVAFNFAHLYRSVWKYASVGELKRIMVTIGWLAAMHTLLITIFIRRMPISYYVVGAFIQFVLTVVARFGYRFVLIEKNNKMNAVRSQMASRVMLIGAGSVGRRILNELHNAKDINERVLCIIDDDKEKWGRYIDDVPVVGGREYILLNVEKYKIEKIYLALPHATAEQRRDILDICKETGCKLKNMPHINDIVNGDFSAVGALRDVAVEDLLGRETAKVDMDQINEFLCGKTVLVTGGGGSIGSEICRQVAKCKPKKLIIFDIYENNAHAIGLELGDKYPLLDFDVLIGSVRDSKRVDQVFAKYKPDVVYHAAAHKHVPLMEYSPCESIKNNALGTYKVAYAAMMNGCKKMVLISTDKAVNPTNIMGASKRICEMVVQMFDKKIREGTANELTALHSHFEKLDGRSALPPERADNVKTDFVAVRFGNVLGSNGSVIPRFKEQIEKGGPVTVTHPDIIRYFMTIPEATSLVLQAGTYAKGGEIFVLDMGSPVKIDTLARNMIRLSGLTPDVDIKISYTGLRPGEKLYEEKLMSEEGMKTTPNKLIHIGSPIPFDTDEFFGDLKTLMNAAYEGRESEIRELVSRVVTTYTPAGEHGSEAKGTAYQKQMQEVKKSEVNNEVLV